MFSQRCIKCAEEFGAEECEVPLEDDGTLLLTTLQSVFPGAKGMKFKNPLTNVYRVVRLDTEHKFHAPGITEEDGWDCDNVNYICVFPKLANESKPLEDWAEAAEKSDKVTEPAVAQPKTVDLIILNLSPQTAEEQLRGYFESKFGPLLMAEIKRDRKTNASRRFAFIRFKNYKDQMRALGPIKHKIDGQQVRLALPDYRDPQELYQENKCFIGRVNEAIKAADLREFFSQFGEIVEISYPKKFKGYAFVTFSDVEVAQRVIGQDFVIKGFSVCVSKSTHGNANNVNKGPPVMNQRFGGGFQNDWNNGWYGRDAPWTPGTPYVTAPLNPAMDRNNANFYGHSAALGNSLLNNNSHSHVNPLNVLSMAMANLAMNQGPMNPGNQNFHRERGQLWAPRNNNASIEPKAKKNNKKKKNAKKPPKEAGDKSADANPEDESTEVKDDTPEVSSPAEDAVNFKLIE